MSELILRLSGKFDEADSIRAELSKHVKVGQPRISTLFSLADPPSLIQLLGDVAAWLPLYLPAKAFLDTFGKLAAEAIWDKIANRNDVKPITDVATTLATAAERVDGKVRISFGLNIPSDYLGTVMFFESPDSEEVARALAYFIKYVEPLSTAMQAEVAAGRGPAVSAVIELQDDESLVVRWWTRDDRAHELQIPRAK